MDFQEPSPSLLKTSANRTVQEQHYPAPFGVEKMRSGCACLKGRVYVETLHLSTTDQH